MQVIEAPVDRVTVYRNGALVVRKGEGQGEVEVLGLPLLFSSDSLRVRPARGVVLDLQETVRLRTRPAPPPPDESARAALALRVIEIDDELRSVEALLAVTEGLAPEPPDPRRAPDVVDPALYVSLLRFGRDRSEPLFARRRELREQRRLVEEQRRELAARDTGDERPPVATRGVRFTLPEGAAFELEYFVAAARWVPSYTLHLTNAQAGQGTTAARSRLLCGALVAQATGEDWSGAALSVCTADLARETNLPSVSSWRMGRAQPEVKKAWRPLPSDLPTLFAGFDHGPRSTRPQDMPPPSGAPKKDAEGFDRVSTDEVRSFEKLSTPMVTMSAKKAYAPQDTRADDVEDEEMANLRSAEGAPELDDDGTDSFEVSADTNAELDRAPRAPPLEMARRSAARDEPAASMAMAMPASKPMPSRNRAPTAGGPGFGGRGGLPEVQRVKQALPARFRTAYMRMAGPGEGMRGKLLPLAPLDRLAWLLDAHDVEDAGRAELGRAVRALQDAQHKLDGAPLPHGTHALLPSHFFAVFAAADRTDVPGDGTFYRVEVRRDEGAAVLEHRCVPRESSDVWRFCKLELKGAPLPAGPLAVYEDGTFRVSTRLDPGAPTRTLDINLGVDPEVRVVGRTVHTEQQEKGLVSQTSRVVHKVKLEVRNARPAPVQIVISDRLPVPADNVRDVTVTMLEEKPPSKRTNKDVGGNDVPGAIEWRTTLMPGDLFIAQHSYAVDLPAKAEIEGGNRRE